MPHDEPSPTSQPSPDPSGTAQKQPCISQSSAAVTSFSPFPSSAPSTSTPHDNHDANLHTDKKKRVPSALRIDPSSHFAHSPTAAQASATSLRHRPPPSSLSPSQHNPPNPNQKSRVHKVTHYGRLRTTFARALRLADFGQSKFIPPIWRSSPAATGTYPGHQESMASATDDTRDHYQELVSASSASPHASTSQRLRSRLDDPTSAATVSDSHPANRRLSADSDGNLSKGQRASIALQRPSYLGPDGTQMGRAIPLPGFFLDPASDEWIGGYSYRARSRDPFSILSVPASLTKRVHYETSYDHPKNGISTARYNVFTFLPAQLMAQFSKIANIYFLFISVLQQVPGWSTTGKWSTLLPLCVFVSFSIAHEGYDDFRRHRMDRSENRKKTRVLKVKVHDKERVSFHHQLRDRFRDRTSHSSISELGRSTSTELRYVAGNIVGKFKSIHKHFADRLAEKRRKQREAEDSEDEEDEGEIEDERELGDVEDILSISGSMAGMSVTSLSHASYIAGGGPLPPHSPHPPSISDAIGGADQSPAKNIPLGVLASSHPPGTSSTNTALGRAASLCPQPSIADSVRHSTYSNPAADFAKLPHPSTPARPRRHMHTPSMSMSIRSNTPDIPVCGTPLTRSFTDKLLMGSTDPSTAPSMNNLSANADPMSSCPHQNTVAFAEKDEIYYDDYYNPLPSNMECRWKRKRWENVQVGDLLVLLRDEWIPADCIVLASSGYDGICYVETAALDGETTLKQRQALKVTNESIQTPEQLASFNGITYVEEPNPDLYSFEGYLEANNEKHSLTPTQLLLRGSVLRNTQYVFVQAIYTGEETRLRLNASKNIRTKSPQLQRITNKVVILVFFVLVVVCVVFSWIALATQSEFLRDNWYLMKVRVSPPAMIFGNIVMLNALIPISLYVTLEAIKIFQMYFIQIDTEMYHEPTRRGAEARTTTINEDLGMVRYVFSDKTGTLTENIMKFRGMLAGGVPFIHHDVDREASSGACEKDADLLKEKTGVVSTAMRKLDDREISPHSGSRRRVSRREASLDRSYLDSSVDGGSKSDDSCDVERGDSDCKASPERRDSDNNSYNAVLKESALKGLLSTRSLLRPEFGAYSVARVTPPHSTTIRTSNFAKAAPTSDRSADHELLEHPPPRSGHSTISLAIHSRRFLRALALCHTVQPDFSEDTGEVVSYQATSPDEKALVSAAAEIGYIVSNRAGSRVQLRITDPERQRRFIEGGYKEVRKAEAAAKVAKRKMRKIEESKKHSESSAENRPVQNAEGNAPHVGYKDENAPGVSSRPSSATETTAPLYTAKMRMLKRPVGFNVGGDSGDEDDENLGERALIIPPDDSDMYEDYEVLDVIEFTSTRKRMSVIYRCPNGKIILLTKGADSVIWERLIPAEKAPAESAQDPFVPSLSVQRSTFQNSTSSNSNGLLYYRRHVSRPRAAVLHSRSSSTNSIDYVPRPSHIYPESPTFGSATNTRPQTPSQLGRQGSAIPRHLTRHTRSQSHSSAYLIGANVPRAHTPLLSQELRSSSMSPLAAPDNTSAAVDLNEARNTSETVISVPPPPALADSGRSSTSSTPTPHHPAASEGWGLGLDIGRSSTSTQRVSGDPPPSKGDGEDQESTMHPEMWNRKQAQKALYLFATEGLRTLVYAHREIPASEYEEWHERYVAASTALVERQKQIEQVADELERNLCLTGVSAIEDRLQDGVPETIYKLRQAGIKIWMLTGDKVETAINIAKSCRLIDEDIVGCSDGLSSESDSEMSGNDSLIILQGVTDAAKLRSELERAFKNLGVSIPDLKSPTRLKRLAYATLPYFVARRLFEHGRHGSAAANKASELPRVPLWQHGLSTGANTHFSEKATDTSTTASSTAADTNAHKDNKARSLTSPPPLAIVIDGETLQTLEHHPQLLELFLELGVHSNAVVCSRVSPAQKALIVHHMRIRCQNQVGEGKYAVTVAVGDGGNDIAMIQESHVGIGIAGQEGLQAARSADFSISQFRFLQRLILVHGRWSYIRISSFTMGTFYKCMAFYLTQALYQVFTGFSGTSLYESWTLSMYNTLFSLLPVIVIGVFDQDLQADTLLKHPELYPKMGPANHIYTVGLFVRHVLVVGLVHCCLVVLMILVPDFNLGDMATSADLYTTGFVLFTVMVFVVTFKISYIDSRRWTWVTHAGAALSLVLWFGWNGLMGIFYPDVTTTGYFAADVFQYIKDCGAYWALIIVVTAIALCITLLFRMSHILTNKAEREIQAWVIHERSRQRIERKISKGAQTIGTARNTFCKRATQFWRSTRFTNALPSRRLKRHKNNRHTTAAGEERGLYSIHSHNS